MSEIIRENMSLISLSFLLIKSYGIIVVCILAYHFFPFWEFLPLFWVIIAARQCTLYELNHEAAHGKLGKGNKINKFISLIFCIIPFFHHVEVFSYVQWRRVHKLHHKYLMTDQDPNYLSRVNAGDADKPYGWLYILCQMMIASVNAIWLFFTVRQDYVYPNSDAFEKNKFRHMSLLGFIKNDKEYNQELIFRLVGYVLLLILVIYFHLWKEFIFFWIIPMYTFFPALLRMFDLLDHCWWRSEEDDLNLNSGSRSVPYLLKFFSSELNRFKHKEHHLYPNVIAQDISKV